MRIDKEEFEKKTKERLEAVGEAKEKEGMGKEQKEERRIPEEEKGGRNSWRYQK